MRSLSQHLRYFLHAYLVLLSSIVLLLLHYVLLGVQLTDTIIERPTAVIFEEALLSAVLLVSLFAIQRVRDEAGVYRPLMFGLTTYYFYALLETSDDVFARVYWLLLVQHLSSAIGSVFLAFGIYRWTKVRERQINLLQRRTTRLQQQNEKLDRFTSVVAHDLRNPLNVITGRAELLRENYADDHVDAIMRSCDRIDDLITELRSLARTGEVIEDWEPIQLDRASKQAWDHVETPDASLEIVSSTTVMADTPQFLQLLENLFRNAVEHGGADVTVRVGAVDTGFFVEDTGSGIPEAKRETMFKDSYSTTSGTGLGLSIVREIADTHGWTIEVTTSDEGGARFEFGTAGTRSWDV